MKKKNNILLRTPHTWSHLILASALGGSTVHMYSASPSTTWMHSSSPIPMFSELSFLGGFMEVSFCKHNWWNHQRYPFLEVGRWGWKFTPPQPRGWFPWQPAPIRKLQRGPRRVPSLALTQVSLKGACEEQQKILFSPPHSGISRGFRSSCVRNLG